MCSSDLLEVDTAATQSLRSGRPVQQAIQTVKPADRAPAPMVAIDNRPGSGVEMEKIKPAEQKLNKQEDSPKQPAPLAGVDVGYIKIIDFDKQRADRKKLGKGIKIHYF